MFSKVKISKIFGIGLSRTGTSSLTEALGLLGFKIAHFPVDEMTLSELMSGNYHLKLLEIYDGITDIVCAPFYPQFDQIYPQSKFILTTRDRNSWLTSMEVHWSDRSIENPNLDSELRTKAMRFFRASTYGLYSFSSERLRYIYQMHEKGVREYFYTRPNDLLIMNIIDGDGWDKLTRFLDVPLVNLPFPKINQRKKHE